MRKRLSSAVLILVLVAIIAAALVPVASAQGPLGYVTGATYSAPHGRGSWTGFAVNEPYYRVETGSQGTWYSTHKGWVQGWTHSQIGEGSRPWSPPEVDNYAGNTVQKNVGLYWDRWGRRVR